MPKPLPFASANQILKGIIQQYGLQGPMALEYLRQHWSEIVGGQIAGHAQPDQIRFHKLYLSIDTPPWMQELAFLKSTLLEKVNAALTEHDAGCSIQEIIFRLSSSPSSIPPPNQKRPNSGN